MNHRPESFEQHQPHQQSDRAQRHPHHVQHSDYHHVGHHRREQSKHDSHEMAHKGQLPQMELTDHHGTKQSGQPHGEKLDNGMVKFSGLHGAAVDTDGSGAKHHAEDKTRQNRTSLTDGKGHPLDTDKDKFVALPKKEMDKLGIKLGDHGFLERADTGEKVPVVFGDVSSGKQWKNGNGQPEASVAALKALGFDKVNGARGVDKSVAFNLTMDPGSRNRETMLASNS